MNIKQKTSNAKVKQFPLLAGGGASWDTQDSYMRWLYNAYEHLKRSKFVYDKKQKWLYYHKPYWEWRFKMEIKRMERIILLEQRIKMECDSLV